LKNCPKETSRKLQFIIAILHDPEFVVLDEPFTGLDPVNQILLKDILQETQAAGESHHLLHASDGYCGATMRSSCLINHGKIVLEGTVKSVKQQFGKDAVRLEYSGDGAFLPDCRWWLRRQSTRTMLSLF